MPVIKGSTNYFEETIANIPCSVKTWYVNNPGGASINYTISVLDTDTSTTYIVYSDSLNSGKSYSSNIDFLILANNKLIISADNTINFYFTIE